MKKMLISIALLIACICNWAYAANLLQVYQQALISDQTFQSAKATYEAATEAYPQAIALILPNIGLTANANTTHTKVFESLANFNQSEINSRGYSYTLSASQPVIDFGAWFNVHAANYSVKQAAATYAAAAQDLLLRTAQSYFNVLLAEDNLRFTESERDSTARQLDQAKQRFEVGLDAITSVYDAQASYDGTVARVIAGKNDVENSKEQLREITNIFYKKIAKLKRQMPLLTPKPNNVEVWVQKANKYNFDIQAAKYAVEEARTNIKAAFSGHLPTVDLEGNITRINDANVNQNQNVPAGNNFISRSAGFSLTLPIYQGGLITSQVRQAQAEYENAVAQLENTHRQVDVELRQTYNSIIAGISKIKADKQTVKSRFATLESTEAALKVGTRTIVDYLLAQQQLFESQSILAEDQYAYINNTLKFKQLAGTLTYKDIVAINSWLIGAKQNQSPYNNPDDGSNVTITKRNAVPVVQHITVKTPNPQNNNIKPIQHQKMTKLHKAKPISNHIYSIQLMARKNLQPLNQFVKQHHLSHQTKIYQTKVHNNTWYVLLYGNYPSFPKAQAVVNALPNELKQLKPWIRLMPK